MRIFEGRKLPTTVVMACLTGQQFSSLFVPPHQCCLIAFPHTAIAAAAAARCGFGRRLPELDTCHLQPCLELGNGSAHGFALGRVGVVNRIFAGGLTHDRIVAATRFQTDAWGHGLSV